MLLLSEAAWARSTVKLDPEPEGERSGLVHPKGVDAHMPSDEGEAAPLRFVAVGDSLVAACGVDSQELGMVPAIAQQIADRTGRPVHWRTHAKLGATMRRVRHRFLPEVDGPVDVLLLCAGSNDIMARRGEEEWESELSAVLDRAIELSPRVLLSSAGQPHNSPRLPRALRQHLRGKIDRQTEISKRLCAERGVAYADVAHVDLVEGFWAGDGFHPSAQGYAFATRCLVDAMEWLPKAS
ncbi:SGNH/GDSL hydrolase family protein [Schaalia sp. 19OD2882]|nr:SGNH/GDSL hydrolase family protein [Schaalia sp. 19OD2882]